jgi:1-acyl-sn-glycerol-3-phosphate acyltransferase
MEIIKSTIVWFIGISLMIVMFLFTFFIWILILPFDKERFVTHRILVYQGLIFSRLLPNVIIEVEGREKAVKGATYVIISNHQSSLDILFMNSLRYKYRWISKIENLKIPILGWYLRMADYIIVNRGNEESKAEMLEKSYRCLKRGISIMIFPEGTRSHDNEIRFFKRGAFQLAIQAEVAILPIVIDGTGGILPKHGHILEGGHHVTVKVLDPIMPYQFETDNPDELAVKLRLLMTRELEKLRIKTNS